MALEDTIIKQQNKHQIPFRLIEKGFFFINENSIQYLWKMSQTIKTQDSILNKLGIAKLNAMQNEAQLAISSSSDIVLLSPTGTGKTPVSYTHLPLPTSDLV